MQLATLGAMRSEAATIANVPQPTTSTAVTIAIANQWLNRGAWELFRAIVKAAGDKAYQKSVSIPLVSAQTTYPLPFDFFEAVAVRILLDAGGTDQVSLVQYTLEEEPFLISATPGWNGEPFKYRLIGKTSANGTDPGSIRFLPTPGSALTASLVYIFGPPTLVNDTDTFDGFAGYDDYAVQFLARRMLERTNERERADARLAEMERIRIDLMSTMRSRDAATAPRVTQYRDVWRPRYARGGRWS